MNVGNLLLLRAAGRAHELGVRRAIGAGAVDVLRQLLTESGVLAVTGGVLGVGLGGVLLKALFRLAPAGLPRADLIGMAGAPVAVGGLVTALAVVLFGVVPSLGTLRFDLFSPLRSDNRSGTESRVQRKVRQALVATQIALALVLLAGAGLLGRSFARLAGLNLGYSIEQVSLLTLTLPWQPWATQCGWYGPLPTPVDTARAQVCLNQSAFDFHDRIMERLRVQPEIVSLSPVVLPPFLGPSAGMSRVVVEGQSDEEGKSNPFLGLDAVGPDFFRTLDIPILQGRGFTDADREGAPKVAVVTEGAARRLWPHQAALGRRFHYPGQSAPDSQMTVVGVIPDVRYKEYREATPTILRPYRQLDVEGLFVVRTRGSIAATLPAIRRAVRDVHPEADVVKAQAMDELIAPQLAQPRFHALLLSTFALAALVLAAIGLYGIMASAVAQQTRELGVRLALGATPAGLRTWVLRQALTVAGAGAVVGLLGALAGSRLLTSMLFEISPSDPVTLIGVSLLLLTVALLAAYLPARRATKIDPARALRAE